MTMSDRLRQVLLHGANPYGQPIDLPPISSFPHTFLTEDLIEDLMRSIPGLTWALEIGSLHGGSALRIANVLQRMDPDSVLVCIDTWLGDANMLTGINQDGQPQDCRRWLLFDGFGVAHCFELFISRVVAAGHSDRIIPFRTSSVAGLRALARYVHWHEIPPPSFIYIDSGHEEGETRLEVERSWNLLGAEGIVCGDDWSWSAVKHDVEQVSRLVRSSIEVRDGQWILRKRTPHSPFV